MKKLLTFFLIISFFIITSTSFSEEDNNQFQVAIIPNKFQVEDNTNYFDLKVKPTEKITLELLLTNTGKNQKKLEVVPTNATTSMSGKIDYSLKNTKNKDSSLINSFKDITSDKQTVLLESGESKVVSFQVDIPEEGFDGIILGGFAVSISKDKNTKKTNENGIYIENKYELIKAVKIQETDNLLLPKLKLNDVGFNWIENTPTLTANIQNTEAVMFGDMTIDGQIREKKSGNLIKEFNATNLEMAPNSNFDFPIFWYDQKIIAGKYTIDLDIQSGNESWILSKTFDVSKKDSTKFSNFYDNANKNNKVNWGKYFLLLLLFITLFSTVIILIFLLKQNKRKKKRRKVKKCK